MSLMLVNRSPDLSQLRSEGYDLRVRKSAHVMISGVPYVTPEKKVKEGVLFAELDLAGEATAPPKRHVAFFVGECPSRADGTPIEGTTQVNHVVDSELTLNWQLSQTPKNGYGDYYAKIKTYINILLGEAQAIDPTVTAIKNNPVVPDEGESVFKYVDTGPTKAGIYELNCKLELGKVAILGVGGTGAYVLDLVAKTPVKEIHLFDGDFFLNHNAFRSPGAASLEQLTGKPQKVKYLAEMYSHMRHGVIAHDLFIDDASVDRLRDMAFVFLCIDRGKAKRLIVERLEEWGVPFIHVGMGLHLGEEALGGMVTATTSTPGKRNHLRDHVGLKDSDAEDEYSRNIQIADLNMLNAAMAVIKWKKHCRYYNDYGREHYCQYMVDTNGMVNEDAA
jgi:hypothetical protein